MQLSIIIVNYNVKHFVTQTLRSIFNSRGLPADSYEVFVVDNRSTDGSVDYLRKHFPQTDYPQLHLIANQCNVGFGRANNQVLDEAKGRYVLYLNPDTLLTEHTLADLIAFADARPEDQLGAIGVKMLQNNGAFAPESRRGCPTPWVSFYKMTGLAALFPKSRLFGRYYLQYLPIEKPNEIEIVSGALMMIPRTALKKLGAFDERFFMYGEDIDLSYRMLQAGRHNYYYPTPILHYKGESTKKNTYRYTHVFYEAMLLFFRKHYRHYSFVLSLPIQAAIILRACISLLGQQRKYLTHFLHPIPSTRRTERMLYLGHANKAIEEIARAYALDIDCIDADNEKLPEGHLTNNIDTKAYTHVIYDLDAFPVDKVLNLFASSPRKALYIGTYTAATGTILLCNHVYAHPSSEQEVLQPKKADL